MPSNQRNTENMKTQQKEFIEKVDLYFEFVYECSINKNVNEACLKTGLQRKSNNTGSKT